MRYGYFQTLSFLALLGCTGTVSTLGSSAAEASLGDGTDLDTTAIGQVGSDLHFSTAGISENINTYNGLMQLKLTAYRIGDFAGSVSFENEGFYYPAAADILGHADFVWNYGKGQNGLPQGWNHPWFAEWSMSNGEATIQFADGRRETVMGALTVGEESFTLAGDTLSQRNRTTTGGGTWSILDPQAGSVQYTDAGGTRYTFDRGRCIGDYHPLNTAWTCYPTHVEDVHGNGTRISYYERQEIGAQLAVVVVGIPRTVTRYRRDDSGQEVDLGRAFFYVRGGNVQAPMGEPTQSFRVPLVEAIAYPGPQSNPLTPDDSWHITRFSFFDHGDPTGGPDAASHLSGVARIQQGCAPRFSDVSEVSAIQIENRNVEFEYGGGCPYFGPRGAISRQAGRLARIRTSTGPQIEYTYQQYQGLSPFGPNYDFRSRNHLPRSVAISGQLANDLLRWAVVAPPTLGWGFAIVNSVLQSVSIRRTPPRNLPPQVIASRTLSGTGDFGARGETRYRWNLKHYIVREGENSLVAGVVTNPLGSSTATLFHNIAPYQSPSAAKAGLPTSSRTYNYRANLSAATFADALPTPPITQSDFGYAVYAAGSSFAVPPHDAVEDSDRKSYVELLTWIARPAFSVQARSESANGSADSTCCAQGLVDGQWLGCQTSDTDNLAPVCFEGDYEDGPDSGFPQYTSALGTNSVLCTRTSQSAGTPRCASGSSVDYPTCQQLRVCGASTVQSSTMHAVVTMHRENAPSRFGMHDFSDTARSDYDRWGNPAFVRTFGLEGTYTIRRPNDSVYPPCLRLNGSDRVRQPWRCGTMPYAQETLEWTGTQVDGRESRFEYLHERRMASDPYIERNLTGLVNRAQSCVLGTTCTKGSGLLSEVRNSYDNTEPYPFADAPGDHSRAPLGRLTRITRVLLEDEDQSPIRAINYYERAAVADQGSGAVAEIADFIDPEIGWARARFAYHGNPGTPAWEPTHEWHIEPNGRTWPVGTASYNSWGQATLTTRENGESTRMCFDNLGRIAATYSPTDNFTGCASTSGASEVLSYRDDGIDGAVTFVTTRTRANGAVTAETHSAVVFDPLGRPSQYRAVRAGHTLIRNLLYNGPSGMVRVQTEPFAIAGALDEIDRFADVTTGHPRLERSFDSLGRIVAQSRVTASGSRETTQTDYSDAVTDLRWNETRVRLASGQNIVEQHDLFGRPLSQLSPAGDLLRFQYNAAGQAARLTHADGLATTRAYDSLGRMIGEDTPEAGHTEYAYSRRSEQYAIRRANGTITNLSFDSRGRVSERWGVSRERGVEREARYFYDTYPSNSPVAFENRRGLGRLVAMESGAHRNDIGYDINGGVSEHFVSESGLGSKHITRTYDSAGALVTFAYQAGAQDALITRNRFDADGDLSEVLAVLPGRSEATLFRVGRDDMGNVASRTILPTSTRPDGLETEHFSYDDFGRLTTYNDPENLGQNAFAFRLGQRLSTLGTPRSDDLPTEVEWARRDSQGSLRRSAYVYGYDNRFNLTSADFRDFVGGQWTNPSSYDFAATYSVIGAPTSLVRTRANGDPAEVSFGYESNTRRLMETGDARNDQFAYDGAGNVIASAEWGSQSAVAYNGSNRVANIVSGLQRMRLEYSSSVHPNRIVHEALEPCATGQCYRTTSESIVVRDIEGASVAEYNGNGALTRLNVPGLGYFTPDQGLFVTFEDHLGSTRVIMRENGTLAEGRDFDPYGEELQGRSDVGAISSGGEPVRFAGYRRDDSLGVPFFLAGMRLYHPGIGRFLQHDPLAADDTQRTSYAYAHNTPNALNDPTGLGPGDGPILQMNPATAYGEFTFTASHFTAADRAALLQNLGSVGAIYADNARFDTKNMRVPLMQMRRNPMYADQHLEAIQIGWQEVRWDPATGALQPMGVLDDPILNVIMLGQGLAIARLGGAARGMGSLAPGGAGIAGEAAAGLAGEGISREAILTALEGVNNVGARGYSNNCGNAVLAFLQRMRGQWVGAAPGAQMEWAEIYEAFSTAGFSHGSNFAKFSIARGLQALGNRQYGVVYNSLGHYFVAVKSMVYNEAGQLVRGVVYVDPQAGTFVNRMFLQQGDLYMLTVR